MIQCFECQSIKEIQFHHVVPRSLGGTQTLPLCLICHGKVHNISFLNHKNLLLRGLQKAKAKGIKLGRRRGIITDLLQKYPDIVLFLQNGESIRNTAKKLNISISTVQRVKKGLK